MILLDYKDQIVCASKYFTVNEMIKIYNLGIKNFGENYVSNLLEKKSQLSELKDVKWHLIGHLQTNKVKDVINQIDFLHTLDSIKLASMIQKFRLTPLPCFIQVNLEENDNKSGIFIENLDNFIKELRNYDKINLIGLMTIGAQNDLDKTEEIFKKLDSLKQHYQLSKTSMGMSTDWQLAIKNHSDILRIGSLFKGVI